MTRPLTQNESGGAGLNFKNVLREPCYADEDFLAAWSVTLLKAVRGASRSFRFSPHSVFAFQALVVRFEIYPL